jgi:PelA/Pel-15E family pectate lyase
MKKYRALSAFCCITTLAAMTAAAETVGTNTPVVPLTHERISTLPQNEQEAWNTYLLRSEQQMTADKAVLAAERAKLTGPVPEPPEGGGSPKSMPDSREADWYSGSEAQHIAAVIVSFQTPAGGWGKNQDRSRALRLPGQDYTADNNSKFLNPDDFDTPHDPVWHYVGTLDNDATTAELRFLTRVATATPGPAGDVWRASFVRGIQYLLNAQYPNGGWPQVWPLEGGYHDAITFNDNAVSEAAEILQTVSENSNGAYAFVPEQLRRQAGSAAQKAVTIILKTQIVTNGIPGIWGQQHDPLTLAPVSARNYEPPLPSTEESAGILIYLMSLDNPTPEIRTAVNAAAAWLKKAALYDIAWTGRESEQGRHIEAAPGAGPLWARYYTTTFQPRFADRDKTIHDTVADISKERRNGYAWYNTTPARALKLYDSWSEKYQKTN